MQQMHPEEAQGYRGYTGTSQEQEQRFNPGEQKLHVDSDELFAETLARKIKKELKDEVRSGRSHHQMRFVVAIVSLCLVLPIIILLGLAVFIPVANVSLLIWGLIIICSAIALVNLFFGIEHL